MLADQDQLYEQLGMGNIVSFEFDLPPSVEKSRVRFSTLEVTGYYERYSQLIASNMNLQCLPEQKQSILGAAEWERN
jgi:hypothetical protein